MILQTTVISPQKIKTKWLLLMAGVIAAGTFISCSGDKTAAPAIFKTRSAGETGLSFTNKLTPNNELNLFSYMYYYNGAGVGAGDFNNDGKTDLFFSANQGDNKLYLNEGGMHFKDVTAAAAIPQDGGWSTGVSVTDINNDGLLDIYVCKVGHYKSLHAKNQLLVCQGTDAKGIPTYKDEAAAYGLDFSGFSTQAAFFDYDGDGDLDMFLLNHSVNHDGNYAPRDSFINTFDSLAGQRLYRNDLVKNGKTSSHYFTNVTKEAGINGSRIGYGLGVVVSDVNMDGWPDFYVGNDFHENDYLYINQRNGTFKEEGQQALKHTSQFSMGVDAADINNDAYPEIISLDMLPYDPYMLRRSLAEDDYNIFMQKIRYGYTWQYARNNLQLNNRDNTFTEAGQYAGIHATDWSWGALWMDFDNDGLKDLFISNGIPKRMNDIDYINFISDEQVQEKIRGSNMEEQDMALVNKFPEIKLPNQFFKNRGNISFANISGDIENNVPSFSNGCVYADFDNDGDPDIVVNNINDPVMLYENQSATNKENAAAAVSFKGASENINGIGAKLVLFAQDQVRTYENYPVRGFQSSMQSPLLVGLSNTRVDSAFVIWPDNSYEQVILKPGAAISLSYKKGLPLFDYRHIADFQKGQQYAAEDITAATGLNYLHVENNFNEFDREPLMPHMVSTEGPAIAVADINHDGLEDLFIGASKTFHNAVFLQQRGGTFVKTVQPALLKDSMWENTSAVWTDVNSDTYPDLVITNGGNEYYGTDEHLLPLLYLNDGNGNLSRKADAFKGIASTQSVVTPFDFNQDGFTDLFIGSRTVPWNYGKTPASFLLQNDGHGNFADVTNQYAPGLANAGMITHAVWFDLDGDGKKDLLASYEWGGVDVFLNRQKLFVKQTLATEQGWWNFILPADVNADGKPDIIAGNAGINNKFGVTAAKPMSLYYGDFDGNGISEQLFTYYVGEKEMPFSSKMELEKRLPYLKKKFLYAADFASADLADLFGKDKIQAAQKRTAGYLNSSVLLNKGAMQFAVTPLPWRAQLTAYRDAVLVNANNDNLQDILLAGNFYENNVQAGRFDAAALTLLINKGNGNFDVCPLTGIAVTGQVRHIAPITINGHTAFVLAKNNEAAEIIRLK